MLDTEAALAAAEAKAGVVPGAAAEAIAGACQAERFDLEALGREGRAAANPVPALVKALTAELPDEAGRFVHWGATSQDVMDTAAMLVAQRTLRIVDRELGSVVASCAGLAERHRATPMAGRTLLQQALPITFGFKASLWLAGVAEARERLAGVELAAQLGGAAGTLASLGSQGLTVLALFAEQLDLAEPTLPSHTVRGRVADLGSGLALTAGALEKVALDVTLLSQTEVGELAESSEESDAAHRAEPAAGAKRRGGSSTLPHKRNPVGSVRAIACARRVRGEASILLAAMAQEHERAAGAWHAEWEALAGALAYTGGAAAAVREVLDGLEVRAARMRENLELTGGLVLAEPVSIALRERLGRSDAHRLIEAAARRALAAGRPFRDELLDDEEIRSELSEAEIDRALDVDRHASEAAALVERALRRYRERR